MVNASAVANNPVTSIAQTTDGRHSTRGLCRGKMIMSYLGKVEMSY